MSPSSGRTLKGRTIQNHPCRGDNSRIRECPRFCAGLAVIREREPQAGFSNRGGDEKFHSILSHLHLQPWTTDCWGSLGLLCKASATFVESECFSVSFLLVFFPVCHYLMDVGYKCCLWVGPAGRDPPLNLRILMQTHSSFTQRKLKCMGVDDWNQVRGC